MRLKWKNCSTLKIGSGSISARSAKVLVLRCREAGVLIAHVETDSEASDLGIKEGDVVMVVQDTAVQTPDDVHRAVSAAQDQHRAWLAVLIHTKTGAQWIPISVGAKTS